MGQAESSLHAKIQQPDPGNLSVRTYQALRESLISGRFKSGDRLVMQDLAVAFGTSVTPVREACLRLVSERGLELRSGRFIIVPELTLERYLEIRTIRLVLEGLAAEQGCDRATKKDIDELDRIHARFVSAERAKRREAAVKANRDFHFTLYQLSGMDMLISHIESLWIAMGPILSVYYTLPTDYVGAEEHIVLIEALRRGDRTGAGMAIRRDVQRGGASILASLSGPAS